MKLFSRFLLIIIATLALSACSEMPWYSSYGHSGDQFGAEAGQVETGPASTYRKADRLPPDYHKVRKQCVTANGQKVCGYDCKVLNGHAKCASSPKMRCVSDHYTQQIACGYDCKSTYRGVKCGQYLYDNCVTNSLGEIKCGNNCREREDGEIICGK